MTPASSDSAVSRQPRPSERVVLPHTVGTTVSRAATPARRVPICRVDVDEAEQQAVCEVLASGWLAQGPKVAAFEAAIAAECGLPHAIATTSCTTALHAALLALGVGPGDEVIVPGFTWVSTANTVLHCGATPVFADIDLATFNIDPAVVESLITPRTVGLLPVHLFGAVADMPALATIAERHGLWMLEDAACALGSRGRREDGSLYAPGELSSGACFSFHPRKSITTGEGGMIVTADERLAEKARTLRNHGAMVSDHQRHGQRGGFLLSEFPEFGFNLRMTDLQAAVGCVQMEKLPRILADRAWCARYYDAALSEFDADGQNMLARPQPPAGTVHSWQSYVALYHGGRGLGGLSLADLPALEAARNELLMRLEDRGVTTRQGTHAPVRLACYRRAFHLPAEAFPNCHLAESLSMALPLLPGHPADDLAYVVGQLRESLCDLP